MATEIYKTGYVYTIYDEVIEIRPLVLKYLREFMNSFAKLKNSTNDDEAIETLSECAVICMKQFSPEISTVEQLEDSFSLPAVYQILDYAAGIKINADKEDVTVKEQAEKSEGNTWDSLDLLKIESEAFLLGIWKNYDEMESSISMPELLATISSKRELDYQEKKFLAAIQGVDLDGEKEKGEDKWEQMKARVFSGGATSDPNDILAFKGINAEKAGFGIGMGLSYEKL